MSGSERGDARGQRVDGVGSHHVGCDGLGGSRGGRDGCGRLSRGLLFFQRHGGGHATQGAARVPLASRAVGRFIVCHAEYT